MQVVAENIPEVALWVVATPIGNLGDISQRAIEVLQGCDCIVAEDTRHSRTLMTALAINTPLVSLHEHNELQRIPQVLEKVRSGKTYALISDAGTPLISDPGYRLVRAFHESGLCVAPVPGACAAIAALSVAGLTSNRFHFEGFLPARKGQRIERLEALENYPDTMIFYESPKRIVATLEAMQSIWGGERLVCHCRELTKRFETVNLQPLSALLTAVTKDDNQQRGEQVLLVSGAPEPDSKLAISPAIRHLYAELSGQLPASKVAGLMAKHLKVSRKALYQSNL